MKHRVTRRGVLRLLGMAPSAASSGVRRPRRPLAQFGRIPTILERIRPAVQRAIERSPIGISGPTMLQAATQENARATAAQLEALPPILAPGDQNGSRDVVAAYYDIATGVVSFL